MADEDDYMSDKFILNTEQHATSSLIIKYSQKRMVALTKRKATADIQQKKKNKLHCLVMEQEKRNEALSLAISSDNKGFEMIMKMGYKPGQGIGKNGCGRSDPIPMNIKTDRLGLGKMADKSGIRKVDSQLKILPKSHNIDTHEFRDRVSSKKLEKLMEIDLMKCQIVCEQLDKKFKVNEPVESWFWPTVTMEKNIHDETPDDDKQESNDDHWGERDNESQNTFGITDGSVGYLENNVGPIEMSTKTKLDKINQYLREFYNYCIWCGTSYNDEIDMKENCPGNTRTDH